MAVGKTEIEIGICPSPGKLSGKDIRMPVAMGKSYDEGTNCKTITVYLLRNGKTAPDKIYTIYLCPVNSNCGCGFETVVRWELFEDCDINIQWIWPEDAGCLLKSGLIIGSKSGITYTETLSVDPGHIIYPVGDERNPDCPGCGMSNASRESVTGTPIPGELFSAFGCFDEETCIATYGANGCKIIGSKYFQTVGFMGGAIHDVVNEEARVYEVSVGGNVVEAKGTDLTEYIIGQWVALAKVNTEFPVDEEENLIPVTSDNVPTVEPGDYIIIPFQFQGIS